MEISFFLAPSKVNRPPRKYKTGKRHRREIWVLCEGQFWSGGNTPVLFSSSQNSSFKEIEKMSFVVEFTVLWQYHFHTKNTLFDFDHIFYFTRKNIEASTVALPGERKDSWNSQSKMKFRTNRWEEIMFNKCSIVKYMLVIHLQSLPFLNGNTTRSSLLMLGNASLPHHCPQKP